MPLNKETKLNQQYLKLFNCVPKLNYWYDINTWNHLTVCKQMIDVE